MSELFVAINGLSVRALQLHVPQFGALAATCELEDDRALPTRVSLQTGDLVWSARVSEEQNGTHALGRKLQLLGGNGNWGALVPPKSYPNDAGVKAFDVARDLATACGEELAPGAAFKPALATLGAHWTRRAGPSSRALEDCTGRVGWWVAADGKTYVGPRPLTTAPAGSYEVLEFDPASRVAVLNVESLSKVGIGTVLTSDRLDAPQTIRSFDLVVTQTTARMYASCGDSPRSKTQLEELFKALTQSANPIPLFGKWRYRVKRMAGQRVELQIVRPATGLPDVLPIRQFPGIPGAKLKLKNGSIVVVEFLEGDPSLPRVTGYAGEEDSNYIPEEIVIGPSSNAKEVACKGDTVKSPLPPAVFSGTIGGVPASGVITWPTMSLTGLIQTGTNILKAGRGNG